MANSYYEKFADGKKVCIDDEIPFEIPSSWEWCRIRHIFTMHAGKNITANRIHKIQSGEHKYPCFGGNGLRGYVTNYNTEGTFPLVGRQGALCGNVNIANGKFYATEHAVVTDSYGLIDVNWAYFSLQALNLNQYATATAQPGLAVSNIIEVFIPLPPIAEQYRIVEKIQELFPIIKRYSNAQIKLDDLNKDIKALIRKSILQEAIQGKLVPQNPDDEPASVLLQRIKEEKQKLVKEGKQKRKDAIDSVIFKGDDNKYFEKIGKDIICIDEEIPFDIPQTWCWVRLDSVCEYIQRGKSPKYSLIKKYPVVAQKCNQWSGFTIDKAQFIEPETLQSYGEERKLQDKDLLWNSTGLGTLGRMAIYFSKLNPYELAVADSHVTVIRPLKKYVLSEYLFAYFTSNTVQSVIEDKSDGSTKQKELATSTVKSYLIPLPPIDEQRRIVAKIDEVVSSIKSR